MQNNLLRSFSFSVLTAALILCSSCSPDKSKAKQDRPAVIASFLQKQHLKGKVVLVQSGIIGCELTEKGLEKLLAWQQREEIPDLHYVRLEISLNAENSQAFFAREKLPFPVIFDPDKKLAKALGANVIPRYILIDKFGRIRYQGSIPNSNSLYDWTETLVKAESDPGPEAPLFGVKKLAVEKLIPATALPDLNGKTRNLSAYEGKTGTLLFFVDTKCPFASSAINEVPKIVTELMKREISTVMINIDDPAEQVKQFYRQKELSCPLIFDSSTKTKLLWDIESVPTLILVNPEKKLFYKGPAIWNDMGDCAADMLGLDKPLKFNAKKIEGG